MSSFYVSQEEVRYFFVLQEILNRHLSISSRGRSDVPSSSRRGRLTSFFMLIRKRYNIPMLSRRGYMTSIVLTGKRSDVPMFFRRGQMMSLYSNEEKIDVLVFTRERSDETFLCPTGGCQIAPSYVNQNQVRCSYAHLEEVR